MLLFSNYPFFEEGKQEGSYREVDLWKMIDRVYWLIEPNCALTALNGAVFFCQKLREGDAVGTTNALDTYKDARWFLIPLDEFNFANPVSDANVLAVPAISRHFGSSYKGKTISTDYMFEKSPEYDDNGDHVYLKNGTGAQWLYEIADGSHIFTSNGDNLYVYSVDMQNRKFLSVNKELSNNINLGNTTEVYSNDINRIVKLEGTTDTNIDYTDINKYYMLKCRHIQSMAVRNNHLYITLGGVNYASLRWEYNGY